MNYSLLSKTYNELLSAMFRAKESGNTAEMLEYAKKAATVASQIAFAPNVMPQVAQHYRTEVERLTALVNEPSKPRPSSGGQKQTKTEEKPQVTVKESDPEMTLEDAMKELNEMIGLDGVKERVKTIINQVCLEKQRKEMGLKVTNSTNHMVFSGNPGTGKTTVARLIAQMYRAIGVLSKGQLVEVTRGDMVAEYEGQTAPKTKKVIEEAMGGVLFIDEAYTLVRKEGNDPFGLEAVNTLLPLMENNRSEFIVIAAGYSREMEEFMAANRGLSSRFKNIIEFEDYDKNALLKIFELNCKRAQYTLTEEAKTRVAQLIADIEENKTEFFGNGRQMRNLLQDMQENQGNRLTKEGSTRKFTKEELMTFEAEDVPTHYAKYIN